jgi:Tol biopolymer transport system component/DNA-binding winged helix-turn-helix (wHTH) protein
MSPSVDKPDRTTGGDSERVAFDRYEMDLRSGELRKDGRKIRLQAQPFQLLAMLVENAEEVVTRDEICRALWQTDTFVDFDHSVAAAVNKIREALNDSVDNPRFIVTVPKRGYRFIGKIKPEAPVGIPVAKPPQALVELAAIPAATAPSREKWTLASAGVAVAVLVAATFLYGWLARRAAQARPETRENSAPLTIVPFTTYPGQETTPSFSPDGSRIAFSWDDGTSTRTGMPGYDLYVKAIASETLLRLTHHPSDWISSAWSPDGTQIAFHRLAADDNGIYVVPALGGPERKLIATHTPYSVAAPINWSPDGQWIAYADLKIDRPGDRTYLLNVETLENHEFPHDPHCMHEADLMFSHSGHELAILCVHNTAEFEYMITDLQGKSRRSLTTRHEFPVGVTWSADDQSLMVAAIDADGDGLYDIRVSDGEVHKLTETAGEWPAVSNDGHKLAISVSDGRTSIWKKDLQHPEVAAVQMYSSTRAQNAAEYSPDGNHVAFVSERSGKPSVWMADAEGNNLVQISREGPAANPNWSPDSHKIVFQMFDEASGLWAVYTADISDRLVHKLKTNIHMQESPYWSHDGKWIYFVDYEGSAHKFYRCPADGGDATLLTESMNATIPVESFDGKLLYFADGPGNAYSTMLELNRPEATPQKVALMPKFPAPANLKVAANGIYFSPRDNPRAISFFDFATKHTRELFRLDKDLDASISVSPDGRYILYSQVDQSNAGIMLVRNPR